MPSLENDGVRAVTYVSDGQVRALSRNGNDVTRSYPEVGELAGLLDGRRAILDGELVALEPGERPSFSRLQQRMHISQPSTALLSSVPVMYFVFDVLHLEGQDLTGMPYSMRRDVLAGLDLAGEHVRVPANFINVDGQKMMQAAELAGLEGVVAKRLTSPYRPGKRAADAWVKVPSVGEPRRPAGDNRRSEMAGTRLAVRYRCGGP